jgi:hypothetical protein
VFKRRKYLFTIRTYEVPPKPCTRKEAKIYTDSIKDLPKAISRVRLKESALEVTKDELVRKPHIERF